MINRKLSALTPTTYKMCMRLVRAINAHPEFRKAKLFAHVFETGRTQTRQNELFRDKKSWVKKSTHQNGSAFDLVLCYKKFKPLKITKIFWNNSAYYDLVAEIANQIGLFSYNLAYKKDAFHFELPVIWQPESDCYAYAVINALRTHDAGWRTMTKRDAIQCAEKLQELAGKKHTLEATLDVAISLGWITAKQEIMPSEVTNDICCVCQTRQKFVKGTSTEKWRAYLEMVENGQGIPRHATAIKGRTLGGGLVIFNSHASVAEYVIGDFSRISKVYKISI